MFDVIISGAGPAGSVAATILAGAGARVLLLDRARFPRDKLCGDTVNPGTLATLRRLGLASRVEPRALPIRGMLLTGERRAIVRGDYGPGFTVSPFCGAISMRPCSRNPCWRARGRGRRARPGAPRRIGRRQSPVRGVVIAGRDGRDIRIPAPLVIAADGRRSRIALALRLARHPKWPRRWAVGAISTACRRSTTLVRCTSVRTGTSGSRRASGLANVCLVTPTRKGFDQPAALLEQAVGDNWYLADRFASARLVTPPVVLGLSPSTWSTLVSRGCCSRAMPPASSTRSPAMACASRFAAPSLPRVSPSARWSGGPAIPR